MTGDSIARTGIKVKSFVLRGHSGQAVATNGAAWAAASESATLASMDKADDQSLMLAYGDGKQAAFDTLYRRHAGPLYRFLLRSVSDRALAEELFQDVWMRLIDSAPRYRPSAKFQTWLYRIAQNRVIDYYRARKPQETYEEGGTRDRAPETAERELERGRLRQDLREALDRLPLEQRTAFLLKAERGMSLEDIAAVAGVGRETIKSRLRYAVAKLRESLDLHHERQA